MSIDSVELFTLHFVSGWRANTALGYEYRSYKRILSSIHVDANCFCSSFLIRREKNAFSQSWSTYHAPEDLLFCSGKDTTAAEAAAVGTASWSSSWWSIAVSQPQLVK